MTWAEISVANPRPLCKSLGFENEGRVLVQGETVEETAQVYPCYTDPVANLTLSIDDAVLRRARIRALESGTTVNAIVRDYLNDFAGTDRARRAIQGFIEIAERSTAGSGPTGRAWTRENLYEERLGHPEHER